MQNREKKLKSLLVQRSDKPDVFSGEIKDIRAFQTVQDEEYLSALS